MEEAEAQINEALGIELNLSIATDDFRSHFVVHLPLSFRRCARLSKYSLEGLNSDIFSLVPSYNGYPLVMPRYSLRVFFRTTQKIADTIVLRVKEERTDLLGNFKVGDKKLSEIKLRKGQFKGKTFGLLILDGLTVEDRNLLLDGALAVTSTDNSITSNRKSQGSPFWTMRDIPLPAKEENEALSFQWIKYVNNQAKLFQRRLLDLSRFIPEQCAKRVRNQIVIEGILTETELNDYPELLTYHAAPLPPMPKVTEVEEQELGTLETFFLNKKSFETLRIKSSVIEDSMYRPFFNSGTGNCFYRALKQLKVTTILTSDDFTSQLKAFIMSEEGKRVSLLLHLSEGHVKAIVRILPKVTITTIRFASAWLNVAIRMISPDKYQTGSSDFVLHALNRPISKTAALFIHNSLDVFSIKGCKHISALKLIQDSEIPTETSNTKYDHYDVTIYFNLRTSDTSINIDLPSLGKGTKRKNAEEIQAEPPALKTRRTSICRSCQSELPLDEPYEQCPVCSAAMTENKANDTQEMIEDLDANISRDIYTARRKRTSPDKTGVRAPKRQRAKSRSSITDFFTAPNASASEISMPITVMGLNCGSFLKHSASILAAAAEHNANVICLQETLLVNEHKNTILNVPGHHVFTSRSSKRGSKSRGSAILFHESLDPVKTAEDFELEVQLDNLSMEAVVMSLQNIRIISLYIPVSTYFNKTALTQMWTLLNSVAKERPTIIEGDFNSPGRIMSNSSGIRSANGRLFDEIFPTLDNLILLPQPSLETYVHRRYWSWLDGFIVSPALYFEENLMTSTLEVVSDHAAILLETSLTTREYAREPIQHVRTINWSLFNRMLNDPLSEDPHEFAEQIGKMVQLCTDKRPARKKNDQTWFDETCAAYKVALTKAKRRWMRGLQPSYEVELQEYTLAIREAKRKAKLEIIKSMDQNPWTAINRLIGGRHSRRGAKKDTSPSNTKINKEKAVRIAKQIKDAYDSGQCDFSDASHDILRTAIRTPVHDQPVIQMWELEQAVMKPKISSAPGFDEISVGILRRIVEHATARYILLSVVNTAVEGFPYEWKLTIINPILKPKQEEDWRPISLLSQLGKIVERIVAYRLEYVIPLGVNQFGCRSSVSIEACIYRFYHFSITKPNELGIIIFFDISKAYDRLPHEVILLKLAQLQLPQWIFAFIYQFLADRHFQVRYKGALSGTWLPIHSGIPQGSPLSVILWKLTFDLPETEMNSPLIRDSIFMDDYAVIIKGTQMAQIHREAQRILDAIQVFGKTHGMKFDSAKTRIMYLNTESEFYNTALRLNNEYLKVTDNYKYLGIRFAPKFHGHTGGLDMTQQEQHEKADLTKRVAWLKVLAQGKQGLSIGQLRMAYFALIRSKISFALLIKSSYVPMLESIQAKAMRVIAGAMPGTPILVLEHLLNINSIESFRTYRAWRIYASLIETQTQEMEAPELWNLDEDISAVSPFGPLVDIHQHVAEIDFGLPAPTDIIASSHSEAFNFGYLPINTPKHIREISRVNWTPPRMDALEKIYFSDGGYRLSLPFFGAAAWCHEGKMESVSFFPCTSGTDAEKVGFRGSCQQAVDDAYTDSNITFAMDSGAILLGIKGWKFRAMTEIEYSIIALLKILVTRRNSITLRFVPSHCERLENFAYWESPLIKGNIEVDQECCSVLTFLETESPVLQMPITATTIRNLAAPFKAPTPANLKYSISGAVRKRLHHINRPIGVLISRLLSDHYALPGYFHRLAHKRVKHPLLNPVPLTDKFACPLCSRTSGTAWHLLFDCSSQIAMQARIDTMSNDSAEDLDNVWNIFPPLDSSEATKMKHYAVTIQNPYCWSAIYSFFQNTNLSP